MELSGKVVFITGSATGLGKAYAEALLGKGSKVCLIDIDEATGKATLEEFTAKFGSENVRFMKLDVSNKDQFEEVFKAAVEAFGQVDIMVNNAAVMNESAWQLMIQVNLLGVVVGTKLAEDHMRKDKGGKGGRIINISSAAGLGDYCFVPVYSATKHAVRSYTSCQANQLDIEAQGIQYATFCPTAANTNLIKDADESRVNYYSVFKETVDNIASPISSVVDAFMLLIQLEKMNGAILQETHKGNVFQKMEAVALGPEYPPNV